jgi:hypothetical protein
MAVLFTVRITGVTISGSCTVDIVDNPWYRVDLPNDHWEITSGSLPGVTDTTGPYARFASLLNLINLARLEGYRDPPSRGDTGAGLCQGSSGGVVEWVIV